MDSPVKLGNDRKDMPTFRDKAIVLKIRPLRNADRQYVVFTERHGKLSLIAKGTRRGKSKMSPHMGSVGVVDIMVAKGRRFDRLAGASLEISRADLAHSFEKSVFAHSFLAAVDALTKRELPEDRIFRLADEFLAAVAACRSSSAAHAAHLAQLFDAALWQLFVILGIAPEVDVCVRCRGPLEERRHHFNVIRGGIECPECSDTADGTVISPQTIKALRFFRSATMQGASVLRLPPTIGRELSWLSEILLCEHADDRYGALRFLKAVAAL